jgi:putative transposase
MALSLDMTPALSDNRFMLRAFEYRLYPTKQQRLLAQQLEECRWLYNHLLAERRDAWARRQESLRYDDQAMTLPILKATRPQLAQVNAPAVQNVAVRIDLAFKAYFRRVKSGETPGYPRFRGKGRYDSITYPQAPSGCKLEADGKRLRLHGVGPMKIIPHRPMEGAPTTATIRRSSTGQHVGIDVGLKTFATLSTGEEVANPRFFRAEEPALAKVQRAHSKVEKDTPERAKHRHALAQVHERTRWRRGAFAHQHSRRITDGYDLIAVEDLSVKGMTPNHCLATSIHDAAWGQFASLLSYKAAWAGRKYGAVNPAYPSQGCAGCGHRQPLSLADRSPSPTASTPAPVVVFSSTAISNPQRIFWHWGNNAWLRPSHGLKAPGISRGELSQ